MRNRRLIVVVAAVIEKDLLSQQQRQRQQQQQNFLSAKFDEGFLRCEFFRSEKYLTRHRVPLSVLNFLLP